MNFNILRFTWVFSAAFVCILVLFFIEAVVRVLLVDHGSLGASPSIFMYLYLIANLSEKIWISVLDYFHLFELAAFGVAAYVEGSHYAKKQSEWPKGIHLLTASTAMAVMGLVIALLLSSLVVVAIGESIPFDSLLVDPMDAYYLAVAIVVCTITCRALLGRGLREMRRPELNVLSENL